MKLSIADLHEMIADVRRQGGRPSLILVSEFDKADLKSELNDGGTDPDDAIIGLINGCIIVSHPHVPRFAARVVLWEPGQYWPTTRSLQ
jgi:hypothetical protein